MHPDLARYLAEQDATKQSLLDRIAESTEEKSLRILYRMLHLNESTTKIEDLDGLSFELLKQKAKKDLTYQIDYTEMRPFLPAKLHLKLREIGPVDDAEFLEKLNDYFRSYRVKRLESENHRKSIYAVFEFNGITKGTYDKENGLFPHAPHGCCITKDTQDFIFKGVSRIIDYLYHKYEYDQPGSSSFRVGFSYSLTPVRVSDRVKYWFDCAEQECENVYRAFAVV